MLGHKVFQALVEAFPKTVGTVRRQPAGAVRQFVESYGRQAFRVGVDVRDGSRLRALLEDLAPEVIVNCVGITKQRDDAVRPIPSIEVNALMPHQIAEWAENWGGRLVHFSTDCVFDGARGGYVESDFADAQDLYGRTKYLGEVTYGRALSLRTSIIGRELEGRRSLLEWFMAHAGGTVPGYTHAIFSGVTTNFLATVVRDMLEARADLFGLFHVASDPIAKQHLLQKLNDAYGLGITIRPDDSTRIDRSLDGTAFTSAWRPVPSWDALISDMRSDPTPYDAWRAL